MTENEKIKEILRSNIKQIKSLAESLFNIRDRLEATQETVEELLNRVEAIEENKISSNDSGVIRSYTTTGDTSSANNQYGQALDLEEDELPNLILQHPTWLRPFSLTVELEKYELEEDCYRFIRSSSGYLRVLRLSNGSEWAYFEQMTKERFLRIPLLSEIYASQDLNLDPSWSYAWTCKPAKLQSLQRGSRWELLQGGQLMTEECK